MHNLQPYAADIASLCKRHHVKTLHAFGSVLTSRFDDRSDVDLIVNFDKMPVENYADNYYDLKFSLQDIFKRPVDLLEDQAVDNPYFRRTIDRSKQLIYG